MKGGGGREGIGREGTALRKRASVNMCVLCCSGKISFYTHPPDPATSAHHVSAEIVSEWSAAFDLVSLAHSLTLAHSHSLAHTRSLTRSLTHTHSHSLTHSRSLTHSHTLTHTCSLTLTHTCSLTLTRALTLAHSHSLAHSLVRYATRKRYALWCVCVYGSACTQGGGHCVQQCGIHTY